MPSKMTASGKGHVTNPSGQPKASAPKINAEATAQAAKAAAEAAKVAAAEHAPEEPEAK